MRKGIEMKINRNFPLTIADSPRILHDTFSCEQANEGQCDCACGATLPITYKPAPPLTNVSYSFDPGNPFLAAPLAANYYVALGRNFDATVFNHSVWVIANHFQQAHLLQDIPQSWHKVWRDEDIQFALEQLITLGLLMPEGYTIPPLTEVPTTLSAWLHITDRCNLNCSYCYLSHKQTDMCLETGRAAIKATFRSALAHDYREVKFKYAGGEPLLRFETITELHQYAQSIADQYGLALDGVVLSNGTLITPNIVAQIQTLGLRLMISLDGLGDFHNCQRHFADGRGSFESVSKAIDLAILHGLIPEISITVSGRNIEGLPELVNWILERELPFSLNFYREHDLSSSETDLHLEEEKIIAGMLAAYKVIESNLPRRSLLSSLVDRASFAAPHLRTCNVGQSYLVFDPQGRVAKCQMDIGKTVTTVYDPDPLARICESSRGIQNLTVEEKAECHECHWQYWCAGGCPLLTYRVTGGYDLKSPNCNIYQALYPEVIRLEGLRLLQSSQ